MQARLRSLCLFGLWTAVTLMASCSSSSGGTGIFIGSPNTGGSGTIGAANGGNAVINLSGGSAGNPCVGPTAPSSCQLIPSGPACGDGKINQESEICDDGNSLPGDGCNGICTTEPNFNCPNPGQPCVSVFECGNGKLEPGEVCDDGNKTANDGCSADCTVQSASYSCATPGQPCKKEIACGDSRVGGEETCDDGNTAAKDGCDPDCKTEAGWLCQVPGMPCKLAPRCGDGQQNSNLGEQCDDGNVKAGDGCAADCKSIESGYQCPTPAQPCKNLNSCGDGRVTGAETCDDANSDSADGCDGCKIQKGYDCPFPGAKCIGKCGDGVLLVNERCDDGNAKDGDGCSKICLWEKGWACSGEPGKYSCHKTSCGDKNAEGSEGCDDANHDLGDGCTPLCSLEPDCKSGACKSACGDGLVLGSVGEQCDDANPVSGDGCSSTCQVEAGYQCKQTDLGDSMSVPVVYRDFRSDSKMFEPSATGRNAPLTGMVSATLDAQGKPVLAAAVKDSYVTSADAFAQWYRDATGVNSTLVGELKLWRRADGSFVNRWGPNGEQWRITTQVSCGNVGTELNGEPCTSKYGDTDCQTFASDISECVKVGTEWKGVMVQRTYDGTPVFFPLDDASGMITPASEFSTATIPSAYGSSGAEPGAKKHNFHFTSEVRYWFAYSKSQTYTLDFLGDDDVWVFINKKLAVDLGGIHTPINGTIVIGANGNGTTTITQSEGTAAPIKQTVNLGLQDGQVYEIVVFQAERQTSGSSYKLTLSGFNASASVCGPICGDGILAPGEQCDDGKNEGGYGKCQPECVRGPYCGDATINGPEDCDNGTNVSAYGSNGCAPGCIIPARCGDAIVQGDFGETCDDGKNDGSYNGCTATCVSAPRCGDAHVDSAQGEECDDGANDGSYGHCAPGCKNGPRCGDNVVQDAFSEMCDDGNTVNGDGCSANCRMEGICGDTIVQTARGEQCDDGKNEGGYGLCGPGCKFGPRCGDGVTQPPEQCDGGENPSGNYGECAVGCVLGPHCGDGRVQTGYEECDDGNKTKRDGCSPTCKTEIFSI